MVRLDARGGRGRAIDRSDDRRVTITAIAVAIAFLVAAVLAALLPETRRLGVRLPLHLAFAGGAGSAIAGVMPFFTAAITVAPPAPPALRWAALVAVALGSGLLTVGQASGATPVAVSGAGLFIAGIVLSALASVGPARTGLGPRGGIVLAGYGAALVMVLIGAALATLYLVGWAPVLEAWARLRPAHAVLNLVGFLSLVIATTLLHLFPTVVGTRIADGRAARTTIIGIATGAAVIAVADALGADVLARAGALVLLAGGGALAAYIGRAWRSRAAWSSDRAWHRFASVGLLSAVVWFEIGLVIVAMRTLVDGAGAGAPPVDILVGPLAMGWVGLAIVASATHLVPAIGPGYAPAHARQRSILGRGATARLVAADAGVLATWAGAWATLDVLMVIGVGLVAAAMLSTALLLGLAVIVGLGRGLPVRAAGA